MNFNEKLAIFSAFVFSTGESEVFNMTKLRIFPLVFLLVLIIGIFSATVANPENEILTDTDAVIMVHSLDYRPLFYIDDSVSKGIMIDYWKLWSERTGIKVKFEAYPWHICLEKVLNGEADVIPGIFYTPERDAVYDFSQAFMEIKVKIYVRSSLDVKNLAELKSQVVGVTLGDRSEEYIKRHYPYLKIKTFDTFEAVIKAASDGEIDLFAMDNPSALFYLEQYEISDQFEPVKTIFVGKFCAAVAEGKESLLIRLNEGIEAIHEDEINNILEDWQHQKTGLVLKSIIKFIITLAVLLIVVSIIWHILRLRGRISEHRCLLNATEKKYQTIIEHAYEGIGVNQNNRYSFVSPGMSRITGYSESQLINRDPIELVHEDDVEMAREHINRFRKGSDVSKTDAIRIRMASDEIKWIQISSVSFEWDGEPAILDFVTDISDLKQAEEKIKEADRQLRTIVETSPIPTIISRINDGEIIYANSHLAELVGCSREELAGRKTPDFYYDPEDRKKVVEILSRDGHLIDYEVRIRRTDNTMIWTIFSLVIGEFAGEKVIIGGLYDISERKKAETALRKERNFVSAVLDTAAAMIVVLDPKGHIVRYNAECEKVTGYSYKDVKGKYVWDMLIVPEERTIIEERFSDILSSRKVITGENRWLTKDGERRLITWSNTLLRDESGAAEYIVAIGIDITEKRKVEENLRLYREIYLNSEDGIVIVDKEGNFVESNPAHMKKSGIGPGEFKGRPIAELLDSPEFAENIKTLKTKGRFRGEFDARLHDGSRQTIDVSTFAIRDKNNEVTAYASIGRDITEIKSAQLALATRARYEEGLAACSAALLEKTDKGSAINKSLKYLLDASDSSRTYIFENFNDPEDGLCMRQVYEVNAEGIEPQIDNPILQHAPYKSGFSRWADTLSQGNPVVGNVKDFPKGEREVLIDQGIISVLAIPIFIEGEWYGFIGFDECTKERTETEEDIRLLKTASEIIGSYLCNKKIEEALRVSEERFRKLVENATDVIYSLDSNGNFSYLSPQLTKASGHDVNSMIGKPVYYNMHEEDKEITKQWIEAGMPAEEPIPGGYQFRMKAQDGTWRWFVSNSSIIRDEEGKVIEAIGVAHDITEMRRVLDDLQKTNQELRDTQIQLVQSEKMASLGMLVAGVAHEINTPVGAITSMHNTLVRAIEKLKTSIEKECAGQGRTGDDLLKYMKIIDEANKVIVSGSERVTNIVRRLRSFARLDEAELKEANINEGIEDTLTIVHHELKHNVEVIRQFGDIPDIPCYPGQLNQVFLNLFINAKQAITDKGQLIIKTSSKNKKVIIEITDNGSGIPEDKLKRIFDPGFTTKGVGVGTGLGLSICYQIIQAHRGEIKVKSTVGKGTTFRVILPTNLDEILDED